MAPYLQREKERKGNKGRKKNEVTGETWGWSHWRISNWVGTGKDSVTFVDMDSRMCYTLTEYLHSLLHFFWWSSIYHGWLVKNKSNFHRRLYFSALWNSLSIQVSKNSAELDSGYGDIDFQYFVQVTLTFALLYMSKQIFIRSSSRISTESDWGYECACKFLINFKGYWSYPNYWAKFSSRKYPISERLTFFWRKQA